VAPSSSPAPAIRSSYTRSGRMTTVSSPGWWFAARIASRSVQPLEAQPSGGRSSPVETRYSAACAGAATSAAISPANAAALRPTR
jgi:hypothetical protein